MGRKSVALLLIGLLLLMAGLGGAARVKSVVEVPVSQSVRMSDVKFELISVTRTDEGCRIRFRVTNLRDSRRYRLKPGHLYVTHRSVPLVRKPSQATTHIAAGDSFETEWAYSGPADMDQLEIRFAPGSRIGHVFARLMEGDKMFLVKLPQQPVASLGKP